MDSFEPILTTLFDKIILFVLFIMFSIFIIWYWLLSLVLL